MIYGETHEEQKVSRLIPVRESAGDHVVTLNDGRFLENQDYWRVQIGRYPISMGPHGLSNDPGGAPLNGMNYVVWGFFETEAEALERSSDEIRHEPWFYGTEGWLKYSVANWVHR